MYNQLLYLVFGIRLLLESNDEKEISIAERLLDMFCRNITSVYQCETAENINVHCLRHLAHQCRSFGPLFVFSAMSFESANRILSQCFSGTHSHCAVICRRYLEEHEPACTPLEEDGATELLREWSSVNDISGENFSRDVYHHPRSSAAETFFRMQQIFHDSSSTGSFSTPVATEDVRLGLTATSMSHHTTEVSLARLFNSS